MPCLGADIKKAIEPLLDAGTRKLLDSIPDCDDGREIKVCGKSARAKSAYQEFTGQCLRDKHLKKFDPGALKDCARQWREKKST